MVLVSLLGNLAELVDICNRSLTSPGGARNFDQGGVYCLVPLEEECDALRLRV